MNGTGKLWVGVGEWGELAVGSTQCAVGSWQCAVRSWQSSLGISVRVSRQRRYVSRTTQV